MEIALVIICSIVFAALMVSMIHPQLVKIAVVKSIVDTPNVRRLNKTPIPVLGGVGVFFGIFMTISLASFHYDCSSLFVLFLAMLLMLFTGVGDDILNLRASRKFLIQVLAVSLLMANGYLIDNLHGLLGIYVLPVYVSYPLTLIAGIGIVNAINLIDGVDGLSSGYGIVASTLCGIIFSIFGYLPLTILAWSVVGALSPFFIHNVFGRKFKMFIGDGGSLVLGIIFCAFTIRILQFNDFGQYSPYVVSLTLAIFSIPIFDTLRVMVSRMLSGRSPFSPDKTHLHHMFIDLGYSHVMTTLIIVGMNLAIVIIWALTTFVVPVSPGWQLLIILALCVFATMGVWNFVAYIQTHNPSRYEKMQLSVQKSRPRWEQVFLNIQKLLK